MKISLHTLIFPRLEVFFLEEWINHNLALGIDKIYIYDNGVVPVPVKNPHWKMGGLSLNKQMKRLPSSAPSYKWIKKPEADYFEEYSDQEIRDIFTSVVEKYPDNVDVTPWAFGSEHQWGYPLSQQKAYPHCVKRNKSDWWLTVDPDEYLVLKTVDSLGEFLDSYGDPPAINGKSIGAFTFSQRVFDERRTGESVREIFNWSYCFPRKNWKALATNIKFGRRHQDIHAPDSRSGIRHHILPEIAVLHHYRGAPEKQGGTAHNKGFNRPFNKTDRTMEKYL